MEPDKLIGATQAVLDEGSWCDGAPTERALVALFALMTPEALDRLLRDILARCLLQLEKPGRDLSAVRDVVKGVCRHQEVDEVTWEFPGGGNLSDAVEAVEASYRLKRAALKSLGHALVAIDMAVGAVVEHRDHQRDPVDWARFHEQWAKEPFNPATVSSDRKLQRERDRREAWRVLLAGLADSSAT